MTTQGSADARFSLVQEEFERNFAERGEVGASVCVTLDGDTVVDLWGGVADPETGRPWEEDTVSTIMSCTKGATATCAHILLDRGLLELDALVARYWPEFAKNGKEDVTVRMLLSHTAGLPHVRAFLPEDAFCDWDYMVRVLEDEELFWPAGTQQGYHGLTYGWLVGEVIRRVSGRTVGQFFADEVAGPLGIDFRIGTPASEHHRYAPLIPAPLPAPDEPLAAIVEYIFANPGSPIGLIFLNNGNWMTRFNLPQFLEAEIPAANGVSNGRGLAGLYRPLALGGTAGGVKLVDEITAARMAIVNSTAVVDASLRARMGFTLGYHTSTDNRTTPGFESSNCIWGAGAFGHGGNGGSIGFADPRARISFGYQMNRMSASMMPDERGQSLMDAVYRSLGYRSNEPGAWV